MNVGNCGDNDVNLYPPKENNHLSQYDPYQILKEEEHQNVKVNKNNFLMEHYLENDGGQEQTNPEKSDKINLPEFKMSDWIDVKHDEKDPSLSDNYANTDSVINHLPDSEIENIATLDITDLDKNNMTDSTNFEVKSTGGLGHTIIEDLKPNWLDNETYKDEDLIQFNSENNDIMAKDMDLKEFEKNDNKVENHITFVLKTNGDAFVIKDTKDLGDYLIAMDLEENSSGYQDNDFHLVSSSTESTSPSSSLSSSPSPSTSAYTSTSINTEMFKNTTADYLDTIIVNEINSLINNMTSMQGHFHKAINKTVNSSVTNKFLDVLEKDNQTFSKNCNGNNCTVIFPENIQPGFSNISEELDNPYISTENSKLLVDYINKTDQNAELKTGKAKIMENIDSNYYHYDYEDVDDNNYFTENKFNSSEVVNSYELHYDDADSNEYYSDDSDVNSEEVNSYELYYDDTDSNEYYLDELDIYTESEENQIQFYEDNEELQDITTFGNMTSAEHNSRRKWEKDNDR